MLYKNILIATAFSNNCERTLNHAKSIAATHNAELHLVHFVEPLPATAFSYAGTTLVDEKRLKSAREKLAIAVKTLGIPAAQAYLNEALPKAGIVNLAKKLNIDLIIVGSHGDSALAGLLRSTADAVVHHSICDILIVK